MGGGTTWREPGRGSTGEEAIPTADHPPRSIFMGGSAQGSVGKPRDDARWIFPTSAPSRDPLINWKSGRSAKGTQYRIGTRRGNPSQTYLSRGNPPQHTWTLREGKTRQPGPGWPRGGFSPYPLYNYPHDVVFYSNNFTQLIRTLDGFVRVRAADPCGRGRFTNRVVITQSSRLVSSGFARFRAGWCAGFVLCCTVGSSGLGRRVQSG